MLRLDSISPVYYKSPVLIGVFIGSVLPFIFAAMTMNAVGTAQDIVQEVRRQFKEFGILEEGS